MAEAELKPADFGSFFCEFHSDPQGKKIAPFPWQKRLAERVARDGWGDPNAEEPANATGRTDWLKLPTAAGKTACIDIAIFALAYQSQREHEKPTESGRTVPRRIFFVVDRRLIVDAAYNRAVALAKALHEPDQYGPTMQAVAKWLGHLAAGEQPLAAFELRGGIYRSDQWSADPVQPTIVCSTVDQVGSRLLYRGYGRSDYMKPIDAGLVGNDAMILLDEAHCAEPFSETLEAIQRFRQAPWGQPPTTAPFALVRMTATPREEIRPFELDAEDRDDPVLSDRLTASKPAKLHNPISAQRDSKKFIERFVDSARQMVGQGARRIGIIVNRIDTARKIEKRLAEQGIEDAHRTLLIGRMREFDRQRMSEQVEARFAAKPIGDPGKGLDDEPARYLVATQTVEVGADLDFDGLVTECASLDALRQRFGRLNRLGQYDNPQAAILVAQANTKTSKPDPIYGETIAYTWNWLSKQAEHDGEGKSEVPQIDMGIDALKARLDAIEDRDKLAAMRGESAQPPTLLPAHLDRFVQTYPRPYPEPEPALFLRGPQDPAYEVQVCWRADFDRDAQRSESIPSNDQWLNAVSQCPPASGECLTAPLAAVRAWLTEQQSEHAQADVAAAKGNDEQGDDAAARTACVIWRGRDESAVLNQANDLRPGDTLVLPLSTLRSQTFAHVPGGGLDPEDPAMDLGDRANWELRRRPVLRLHHGLLKRCSDSAPCRELQQLLTAASFVPPELPDDASPVLELLQAMRGSGDNILAPIRAAVDLVQSTQPVIPIVSALPATTYPVQQTLLRQLREGRRIELFAHPLGGIVLRGQRVPKADHGLGESVAGFTSEDETASASNRAVPLHEHTGDVAERARAFAEACGLPMSVIDDFALAGRLHDLGKADPRFQAYLHGGNARRTQQYPWLLAKSAAAPETRREHQRAWRDSDLPDGFRHEMATVQLVEAADGLSQQAHDPDLVLHLIATHHGRARPLAPVVLDERPRSMRVENDGQTFKVDSESRSVCPPHRLDAGIPERFWLLVRRYGWWGLAHLEAIFRLADHRASEQEQREPGALQGKQQTTAAIG
jgi:CRISPR-associated endonuclease/helicase Cas3